MFGPGRRVARRTARRTTRRQMAMRDAYEEPYYDEPQAAAPPPAPAQPDLTTQLAELAKLKEQGIITEEDFEAKKKQILGI
jgi:Short C-terminal domain